MVAAAGKRRERVVFERAGQGRDEWNEPDGSWGHLGQALAAVFYGSGSERRQAAMEQGSQAASFVCLATELTRSIKVSDRITHRGVEWDINGIAAKDREVEFTASRAA